MTTIAFILGWLTGVLCMFAIGWWASMRATATALVVVAEGGEIPEPPDWDEPVAAHGDPLAITCRACDAPPGVGCAVLRTGLDRDKPHLVRLQDIGRAR